MRIGAVHLVQVDVVGAEPAQAVLHGGHDPAAGVALAVGVVVVAHRVVELGGQHHLVTTGCQRGADDLLGGPVAVHVGGVDQVQPGVEGAVNDAAAGLNVGVAPRTEHHGAQRKGVHPDAAASDGAELHGRRCCCVSRGPRRG